MEAIVLVGGQGTRLRSVLPDLPKALAPVNGIPFLIFLLRWLEVSGLFSKIILAVGYRADQIRAALAAAGAFSFAVEFSEETSPLGTGGAARLASELLVGQQYLLLNGDSFIDLDLMSLVAFHREKQAELTLVTKRVADVSRYGSVILTGDRVDGFLEKKASKGEGPVNAGIYLVERAVTEPFAIGQAFSWEQDVLPAVLTKRCYGFECSGKFIDIGLPETFEAASAYLSEFMQRFTRQ